MWQEKGPYHRLWEFFNTALAKAVKEGDERSVDSLLNGPLSGELTLTLQSIEPPFERKVKTASVNQRDTNGDSFLHHAVACRQLNVVTRLLKQQGIEPSNANYGHKTPLSIAVDNEDLAIVEQLLEHPEIIVGDRTVDAITPLMQAAIKGHLPILKALLAASKIRKREENLNRYRKVTPPECDEKPQKTLVNRIDKNWNSALHHAVINGHMHIVECLLQEPEIVINGIDSLKNSALHYAVMKGHLLIVKRLLQEPNIVPDIINHLDQTPLILAIINNNEAMVETLLTHPDIVVVFCNEKGKSALIHAVSKGYLSIVDRLLKYKGTNNKCTIASMNAIGGYGLDALHQAVIGRQPAMVQRLLQEQTVAVNRENALGQTPLMVAVLNNDVAIVEMLLHDRRVRLARCDKAGKTALHHAAGQGYLMIIEHLLMYVPVSLLQCDQHHLSKGIENPLNQLLEPLINHADAEGNTALHCAVLHRQPMVVYRLLHQSMIKIDLKNGLGETPLMLAERSGAAEIKRLLSPPVPQPQSPLAPRGRCLRLNNPLAAGIMARRATVGNRLPLGLIRPPLPAEGQLLLADNGQPAAWAHASSRPGNFDAEASIWKRRSTSPLLSPREKEKCTAADGDDALDLTSLMVAVTKGNLERVEALLSAADTDAQARDSEDQTALELLSALDEAGDDDNMAPESFREIMRLLLEHLVNELPRRGLKIDADKQPVVLRHAAQVGRDDLVQHLLEDYPQIAINDPDKQCGQTALMLAVMEGHRKVVTQLLLQPAIKVSLADNFGQTALGWAVENGHHALLKELLHHPDSAAAINLTDQDGRTPLTWAMWHNDLKAAEMLLGQPALTINQQGERALPLLLLAVTFNRPEMVTQLLSHGADPEIKDSKGRNALAIARLFRYKKVEEQLLSHPAKQPAEAPGAVAGDQARQKQQEDYLNWLLQQCSKARRSETVKEIIRQLAVDQGLQLASDDMACCSKKFSQDIAGLCINEVATSAISVPGASAHQVPTGGGALLLDPNSKRRM